MSSTKQSTPEKAEDSSKPALRRSTRNTISAVSTKKPGSETVEAEETDKIAKGSTDGVTSRRVSMRRLSNSSQNENAGTPVKASGKRNANKIEETKSLTNETPSKILTRRNSNKIEKALSENGDTPKRVSTRRNSASKNDVVPNENVETPGRISLRRNSNKSESLQAGHADTPRRISARRNSKSAEEEKTISSRNSSVEKEISSSQSREGSVEGSPRRSTRLGGKGKSLSAAVKNLDPILEDVLNKSATDLENNEENKPIAVNRDSSTSRKKSEPSDTEIDVVSIDELKILPKIEEEEEEEIKSQAVDSEKLQINKENVEVESKTDEAKSPVEPVEKEQKSIEPAKSQQLELNKQQVEEVSKSEDITTSSQPVVRVPKLEHEEEDSGTKKIETSSSEPDINIVGEAKPESDTIEPPAEQELEPSQDKEAESKTEEAKIVNEEVNSEELEVTKSKKENNQINQSFVEPVEEQHTINEPKDKKSDVTLGTEMEILTEDNNDRNLHESEEKVLINESYEFSVLSDECDPIENIKPTSAENKLEGNKIDCKLDNTHDEKFTIDASTEEIASESEEKNNVKEINDMENTKEDLSPNKPQELPPVEPMEVDDFESENVAESCTQDTEQEETDLLNTSKQRTDLNNSLQKSTDEVKQLHFEEKVEETPQITSSSEDIALHLTDDEEELKTSCTLKVDNLKTQDKSHNESSLEIEEINTEGVESDKVIEESLEKHTVQEIAQDAHEKELEASGENSTLHLSFEDSQLNESDIKLRDSINRIALYSTPKLQENKKSRNARDKNILEVEVSKLVLDNSKKEIEELNEISATEDQSQDKFEEKPTPAEEEIAEKKSYVSRSSLSSSKIKLDDIENDNLFENNTDSEPRTIVGGSNKKKKSNETNTEKNKSFVTEKSQKTAIDERTRNSKLRNSIILVHSNEEDDIGEEIKQDVSRSSLSSSEIKLDDSENDDVFKNSTDSEPRTIVGGSNKKKKSNEKNKSFVTENSQETAVDETTKNSKLRNSIIPVYSNEEDDIGEEIKQEAEILKPKKKKKKKGKNQDATLETNIDKNEQENKNNEGKRKKTLTSSQLDLKIDELLESLSSESDEETANSFIDYEAEEGEEDTPSEGSNDIPERGEDINTSESEFSNDESYEKDSFIDDDEAQELLSGEEYDISSEDVKKSNKRIIELSSDSDNDAIIRPVQTSKKSCKKKKKKSRIIKPKDSSDEEAIIEIVTTEDVSEKYKAVETIEKENLLESVSDSTDSSKYPHKGAADLDQETNKEPKSKIVILEDITLRPPDSPKICLFKTNKKRKLSGLSLPNTPENVPRKKKMKLKSPITSTTSTLDDALLEESQNVVLIVPDSGKKKKNKKRKNKSSIGLTSSIAEDALLDEIQTEAPIVFNSEKKKKKRKNSTNVVEDSLLDESQTLVPVVYNSEKKKKKESRSIVKSTTSLVEDESQNVVPMVLSPEKNKRKSGSSISRITSIEEDALLKESQDALPMVPSPEKKKKKKYRSPIRLTKSIIEDGFSNENQNLVPLVPSSEKNFNNSSLQSPRLQYIQLKPSVNNGPPSKMTAEVVNSLVGKVVESVNLDNSLTPSCSGSSVRFQRKKYVKK